MASPSSRFYLEELSEEKHLNAVHELFSNAENLEGDSFQPVTDLEANRTWLHTRSRAANPEIENFAIVVPASSPLYEAARRGMGGGDANGEPSSDANGGVDANGDASTDGDAGRAAAPVTVGFVGVIRTAPPELGYMVVRPVWGRGVATQAVGMMLARYWAARPGVRAVEAYIDEANAGSRRVAAKAGFVEEPGRRVAAGGMLPSGEVVTVPVGIWVIRRPDETA